jgi:FkbM family methyltransferase
MGVRRRLSVALDMLGRVGLASTLEMMTSSVHQKLHQWRWKTDFRRLQLSGSGLLERDVLGSRMCLDPSKPGLDREILIHGVREPIATGHLMRILRPDDVLLEAGANIGYYTLLASRLCRRVYAVEPHPENYERLAMHITLNGASNVEVFPLGFGPTEGPIHLRCSELSNWHSCVGAVEGEPGVITVHGRTIDGFVDELQEQPTFLRMDIEGYEAEVLKGASQTLRGLRGLFLELHGIDLSHRQITDTIDLIEGAGLRCTMAIKYDWPGQARVYPGTHIESIRAGDRDVYEVFFGRDVESQ